MITKLNNKMISITMGISLIKTKMMKTKIYIPWATNMQMQITISRKVISMKISCNPRIIR